MYIIYVHKQILDIYEFILWDNCNNNCSFCWQKQHGHISTTIEKTYNLDIVLKFIESDKFSSGSHILVVGGEIFDQSVSQIKLKFKYFWDKLIHLQTKNHIGLIYINTNLLYTDLKYIKYLFDIAQKHNVLDRLKFTTSYDLVGRFQSAISEEIFSNNLKTLMNTYPTLNCVINTILTKQFCEYHLKNNNYSFIRNIKNKYTERTTVNFLPYISIDKNLIPERSQVFEVLLNEEKLNPGFLSLYTSSMSLNQLKHVYKIENNELVDSSCELCDCGHPINFKRYSKHNSCFVCDLRRISDAS